MELHLLIGPPGSGKSTWTAAFKADHSHDTVVVASSDNYFIVDNVYKFDQAKLAEAHRSCFRTATLAVMEEADHIVIDNTNLTLAAMAPYIALGEAFGYTIKFWAFTTRFQNVHGVPPDLVERHEHLFAELRSSWPDNLPIPTVVT